MKANQLLDYSALGGNIVFVLPPKISDTFIDDWMAQLRVSYSKEAVQDDFNGENGKFIVNNIFNVNESIEKFSFEGKSFDCKSPLFSSFALVNEESIFEKEKSILIGGFQTFKNSRIVISGSSSVFENEYLLI